MTAFLKTVEMMTKPQQFFASVAASEDPKDAVKFGMLCWVVGASARAAFGFLFGGILDIGLFGGSYGSFVGNLLWLGWNLGVAAAMGFIAVNVFAKVSHSMLESQKAATRSANATLRVAGYSGVAGLLFFVPGHLGNFVFLATVLLNMLGLEKMHRAEQGKALVSAVVASFVIGAIYVVVLSVIAAIVFATVIAAIL